MNDNHVMITWLSFIHLLSSFTTVYFRSDVRTSKSV